MSRPYDAPPPGVIDRRDGNTKGECGITSTACLFCKDQISVSAKYIDRFDKMKWAKKNKCQTATCPFWGTTGCWQKIGRMKDPKKCPIYIRRQHTGKWDVEPEILD